MGSGLGKAGKIANFFGSMLGKSIGKKIHVNEFRKVHQNCGDWEYDAAVEFFGLNITKPTITTDDLIRGEEAIMLKHIENMNWQEKKRAFEDFMGYKFKGVFCDGKYRY